MVKIIKIFITRRPFSLSYVSGYAHIAVIVTDTIVHITVNMAVHKSDQVYFESFKTCLYASRLKSLGHIVTSFRTNESGELRERAITLTTGNKHAKINIKHAKAIIKSPIFSLFDLIIFISSLYYHISEYTAFADLFCKCIRQEQENNTYHRLE